METYKNVTCKGHDHKTHKILVEVKLPENWYGLNVDDICSHGNAVRAMLNSLYPTTETRPHIIRFYTEEGIITNFCK
ncbi:MAG TPA: hypothetical protein P5509_03585 [Bacteroidales bacterium]|nr:hypothetical protein [Bacteroidales bacterium]